MLSFVLNWARQLLFGFLTVQILDDLAILVQFGSIDILREELKVHGSCQPLNILLDLLFDHLSILLHVLLNVELLIVATPVRLAISPLKCEFDVAVILLGRQVLNLDVLAAVLGHNRSLPGREGFRLFTLASVCWQASTALLCYMLEHEV